jgi:hypothetical protein
MKKSIPKRIVWVSRHPINGVQMGVLQRMFGSDVEVIEDSQPFDNAESIVRRFREGGFDDMIVIAPYSVLNRIVELGPQPLWAEAKEVNDPNLSDWSIKGRFYRFLGFKRVKRMVLELEDLGPEARRQESD